MQNLRNARLAAGLTMEQLAEHLGVSSSAVYTWETGAAKPYPRHMKTIEAFIASVAAPEVEDDGFVDVIFNTAVAGLACVSDEGRRAALCDILRAAIIKRARD